MKKVLITAGPTREPIDPVRFLSNRSSGKMGYALAEAAVVAGCEVTLVSGPVCLDPPAGVKLVSVMTASEMYGAVEARIEPMDLVVCCAAVADYTPIRMEEHKLKKKGTDLNLTLMPTKDILGSCREVFGYRKTLVGFAAETQELERYAREKLARKGCDWIAANRVDEEGSGFEVNHNEITLFSADGQVVELPRDTKPQLAENMMRMLIGE